MLHDLSDDLVGDILLWTDLRSLFRLSVTSLDSNAIISKIVGRASWWVDWRLRLYPDSLTTLPPNEAIMIEYTRRHPVTAMRFAVTYARPEMLSYVDREGVTSFEYMNPHDIQYLVEAVPNMLLHRAANATQKFPLQRVRDALGDIEVFASMLDKVTLLKPCILFSDVLRDEESQGSDAQKIFRLLQTAMIIPLPIGPVIATNLFVQCLAWRKCDAMCMAMIDGTPRDTVTGRIVAIDSYLYTAVDRVRGSIVAYLLTLGANPNDNHEEFTSSLQRAVELNNQEIVRMLTQSPSFHRAKIYRPVFNKSRVGIRRLIQSLIAEGKVEIITR